MILADRVTPGLVHFFILAGSMVFTQATCMWGMYRALLNRTDLCEKAHKQIERAQLTCNRALDMVNEARGHEQQARDRLVLLEHTLADVYRVAGECGHDGGDLGICLDCMLSMCERMEQVIVMPDGEVARGARSRARGTS